MGSTAESPSWNQRFGDDPEGEVFTCLAEADRRRLLGFLYKQPRDSVTRRDLATYLVPGYQENPRDGSEEVQQKVVRLHHIDLPKLETAGLIEQDPDRGTATLSDHSAFQDAGIIGVITEEANADSESLDILFNALADSRHRTILDVLSHQFGPIHMETLAREIGAREQGISESEVQSEDVQQILVSLVQAHLPVLSEAELIDYDADDGMVAYKGHPELRVPWMHSVLEPEFRPSLTGETDPDGMGEIEGRERVISFCQSLFDRADEELFCMFTDTDLLEAGCLTRIRDASQVRNVDVYLGTCDPTVREYIRENAPEVMLWEPKENWLNLPVEGNNVGRLLLADREAVMLGTLREKTEDGFHEEKAVVGEGTDNALVVMVAQLIGHYLQRIDEQSEDIEDPLPF